MLKWSSSTCFGEREKKADSALDIQSTLFLPIHLSLPLSLSDSLSLSLSLTLFLSLSLSLSLYMCACVRDYLAALSLLVPCWRRM